MQSRWISAGVVAFGLAVAGDARADSNAPPPADAERLRAASEEFDAGRRAYRAKDFENAAIHFENADRDAPSPEALTTAIRARKEAKHHARAATLAALALARYPNTPAIADFARELLASLSKGLHKLSVSCTPACSFVVDSRVMPFPDATSSVVYLDPGRHAVVVGWSGDRNVASDVNATAGGASQLAFEAPPPKPKVADANTGAGVTPTGAAPAPDPDREPKTEEPPEAVHPAAAALPPAVFFVGAGATALLGGLTIWSGLDTQVNPGVDRVRAECAGQTAECPTYQEGLSHQRRTNVLLVGTAIAGVATAVVGVFFTKWEAADRKAPSARDERGMHSIAPVLSIDHGVSVGAVGRF